MTPLPRPSPLLGSAELDVASTLINEANALLRLHGEDPGNDGTGDDLPVLTEVIFDLGEAPTPSATPARPKPATPAATPSPSTQAFRPQTSPPAPRPQGIVATPAASTVLPNAQSPKPQTAIPPASPRPSTPRAQGVAPVPTSTTATPPRPTVPSASSAQPTTSTVVAPKPSPQSGLAAHSQPQPRLRTMWSQTTLPPNTPSVAPSPKPRATTPTRQPVAPAPPPAAKQPPPLSDATVVQAQAIAEKLKQLDTLIVGEVEAWLREELPALVVREISRLNERLRAEAIAHLRATLLPRISEHISGKIEKIGRSEPNS